MSKFTLYTLHRYFSFFRILRILSSAILHIAQHLDVNCSKFIGRKNGMNALWSGLQKIRYLIACQERKYSSTHTCCCIAFVTLLSIMLLNKSTLKCQWLLTLGISLQSTVTSKANILFCGTVKQFCITEFFRNIRHFRNII